jgi:NADPH2:quinone reductase
LWRIRTRLCCDAVDFGGAVVSIVNGPRSNPIAGGIADEDVLFNKSSEFHFELLFAQTEYAPARPTAVYAQDLQRIATLIASGDLRLPRITEIGVLSADTVRNAHRMLESGHTIGKLVATVS